MNYGLISIDSGSVNLGNRLIEFAVSEVLNLPKPKVTVSMFSAPTDEEIERLNYCDFVLIPGSTVLARAPGNSDALAALPKIRAPKLCIAASGWKPRYGYYTEAIKNLTPPIGCRDPDTLRVCKSLGVPAVFTGCPTAYLRKTIIKQPETPFSVVGFGRDNTDLQLELFGKLTGKFVAAVQEKKFALPLVRSLKAHYFTYEDINKAINWYAKASFVLTGRLHGVLPAMSQHKKVMFFGNPKDSRFGLLKHLGIPVHTLDKNTKPQFVHKEAYVSRIEELKENFLQWGLATGLYKGRK